MSFIREDIFTENNDFNPAESDVIDNCLLKNSKNDIIKSLECLNSEDNFLYIHGFLGTGKRQFVDYICEYLSSDVLTLKYFCKEATVCDDILLSFIEELEKDNQSKNTNLNAKITTLSVKFQQMLEQIKKPTLIILHTFDNIQDTNKQLALDILSKIVNVQNVKIIVTTCALIPDLTGISEKSKTIYIKAFTKDIFKEFVEKNEIKASDKQIEDLYELTRGYYLYAKLSIKIIQTLEISVAEFLQKIKEADTNFDSYLGELYISLIPASIRNFFWFLKAVRHGLSLNALAIFDIYDEFSIQYLTSNLILFVENETIYLHDYFAQRISTILPENTEIRLHKYIIGIYEKQLKETLANRAIFMSRQALRAEIDYHSQRIQEIESGESDSQIKTQPENTGTQAQNLTNTPKPSTDKSSFDNLLAEANKLMESDKLTEAIEKFTIITEREDIDLASLVEVRLNLARLYFRISDYTNALHYFELVETYYKSNKEYINLNYLYYEMTELYYKTYKTDRAIETIKQVIYSVDTPQSLMVSACTLLGNIYSDTSNPEEAFTYYQKALDSLDENVEASTLAELYFKFALANDDKNNLSLAFEYYNRCISISHNKFSALAYSNIASCYYENGNFDDALGCYIKAYEIEKTNNNYDGIYYTSSQIALLYTELDDSKALKFLEEAKQSAEFINDSFCIVKASVALGDYYYNLPEKAEMALKEYCTAKQVAMNSSEDIDISNIEKRIDDMKLRLPEDKISEILRKYD